MSPVGAIATGIMIQCAWLLDFQCFSSRIAAVLNQLIFTARRSPWSFDHLKNYLNLDPGCKHFNMGCISLYIPLDNWSLLRPASQIFTGSDLLDYRSHSCQYQATTFLFNGSFVISPNAGGNLIQKCLRVWFGEQCKHTEFASLHYRGEFFAPMKCKVGNVHKNMARDKHVDICKQLWVVR